MYAIELYCYLKANAAILKQGVIHPDLLKLSLLLTELSVHSGNDFLQVSPLLHHGFLLLGQTVLHH